MFSNIWAGGGIQTGGILGASDKRGAKVMINDFNGRPAAIVNDGRSIPELSRARSRLVAVVGFAQGNRCRKAFGWITRQIRGVAVGRKSAAPPERKRAGGS